MNGWDAAARYRVLVRPYGGEDRRWAIELLRRRWGGDCVIARGSQYQPLDLAGFVALHGSDRVGLVTYSLDESSCQIVTLDSLRPGNGIGTALVEAVMQAARAARCTRIWLVTTNDNLSALRFYQRRGFTIAAVHPGAVMLARRLKPQIPLMGQHGIPIRDEIELEMACRDE